MNDGVKKYLEDMEAYKNDKYVHCNECPYCYDPDPAYVDYFGNHPKICGMSGNMVYTEPRKVKRLTGSGYIHYDIGSCGLYRTVEDALKSMCESERRRYYKNQEGKEGGEE